MQDMARPLSFRWDEEFVAAIDRARGDVPRSVFVRRAIEEKLGLPPPAGLASPNEGLRAARQALSEAKEPLTKEQGRSATPAEQSGDVEQALGNSPNAFATPTPAERPPVDVPRRHLPGPNVENIRSSAQSKRDVRPIPKRGER